MVAENQKKKLLLVEDQKEYSLMVKVLLSKGYDITTVENGLEAMSILDNNFRPDVIITDLRMPVLDGFRFINLLRQSGKFSDIPVVILTGMDSDDIKMSVMGKNVFVLLNKPDDASHLLNELVPAIESACLINH